MPTDFATLTVHRAKSLAEMPQTRKAVLDVNRLYYNGDHWQNGTAWGGPWPMPIPGMTPEFLQLVTKTQDEIRRNQVTVNAIKEVVDRDRSGTIGIEPRWSFGPDGIRVPPANAPATPTPDEIATEAATTARATRANSLLTTWWDTKGVHETLQRLAERLLYGSGPDAVASLRLFVPTSALADEVDGNGKATGRKLLTVRNIEDALDKIHVETLDEDQGRVVTDPDTFAEIGIKPTKRTETEIADVTFLDASTGRTVIATITPTARPSVSYDLGGRLTMLSVSRREFVTEPMRQSQKALNFAAFIIRRNNESAGFLQDTLLNGELPGHFEGDEPNRKYVPDPVHKGPFTFNSFRGIVVKDANGNESLTTPTLDHRAPIDPTGSIKAKTEHYADVLGAANQRHVLMANDLELSGEAWKQARAEHVKSLRVTQAPLQRAGRWVLETALSLADALANGGNGTTMIAGLRATFTCVLDAGPVSDTERAQNLAEMREGALSRESAIERNGIIDVDAELARIRSEPNAGLDAELKRAQIFNEWSKSIGEDEAARRAGLSKEEIDRLVAARTDTETVAQ